MDIKSYLFSKEHIWVMETGPHTVRIGISDYAQRQLNAIIFLNLPDIGEEVSAGERLGDVESLKTVSDLISPVSGTVVGVNLEVADAPEAVNTDPYGSWLAEIRADSIPDDLMDHTGYQRYLESI